MHNGQTDLPDFPQSTNDVKALSVAITGTIAAILATTTQPSAAELLDAVERKHGWFARHVFTDVVRAMRDNTDLIGYTRQYLKGTLSNEEIESALRHGAKRTPQEQSSIDELFRASILYRNSSKFAEALEFAAKFREYAPYNNMLVRVQNPSCSYYATARDWQNRFERSIKEDAKPMVILAPMHPVMIVYDVDETEGAPLPAKLREFAQVTGNFESKWMDRLLENALRLRIQVQRKPLTQLHGGFATTSLRDNRFKMRVVVHAGLDEASAFGVLCHEIGHILLGHLGSDMDIWWPFRINLPHSAIEIEAESVSYMVSARLGLKSGSASYIASFVSGGQIPDSVSLDLITKVAGKICEMTERLLPERTLKVKEPLKQKFKEKKKKPLQTELF
jgi:hypothetical protein